MHELSLVTDIVEMVSTHPDISRVSDVRKIRLRVGESAGVEVESLAFCFECLAADSPLADTSLEIERVPYAVACRFCASTSRGDPAMSRCPGCGSGDLEVISGRELDVVSIELNEEETV